MRSPNSGGGSTTCSSRTWRHLDGSFTLNREPFPVISNILGSTAVGFLAGLVLGGTVLKTNAGVERAKLIQSTLAASATDTRK